jgi:hypothetical protein
MEAELISEFQMFHIELKSHSPLLDRRELASYLTVSFIYDIQWGWSLAQHEPRDAVP